MTIEQADERRVERAARHVVKAYGGRPLEPLIDVAVFVEQCRRSPWSNMPYIAQSQVIDVAKRARTIVQEENER